MLRNLLRNIYPADDSIILGGFVDTPCYDGDLLKPGNKIEAPAIIEERKTTVVVPPGSQIVVDAYENYLVTLS